jgi:hypothetical protein
MHIKNPQTIRCGLSEMNLFSCLDNEIQIINIKIMCGNGGK